MLFKETLTLPLQPSQLQTILSKRSAVELTEAKIINDSIGKVSYKNSTLKNDAFINYVSNLKLSINLDVEGVSKEDKFELLKCYMKHRNISDIKEVSTTLGVLLLKDKGLIADSALDIIFSKNEMEDFAKSEKETITKWHHFLESILVGVPYYSKDYAASVGKDDIDSGKVKINSDNLYVGTNIATLVADNDFTMAYFSLPPAQKFEPTLFEMHLFDPIFQGHSLVSLLIENNNPIFMYMMGLFEGWVKAEEKDDKKDEGSSK